jgi:hypothetical protein
MSYSGPFINSILNATNDQNNQASGLDISSIDNTSIQGTTTTNRKVEIKYNGTGIHTYTYSTPMLTLSHSYNRTEGGILLSTTNRINLTGKIHDAGGTSDSISDLLSKESGLKNMFSGCPVGDLEVTCEGAIILSASGVRALSVSTDASPDNLTRTLGYTVDLEYYEKAPDNEGLVTTASDSWSIEPIEDYVYTNFNISSIAMKALVDHRPISPAIGALEIRSIPQFRVSHRVSAKGAIPQGICGSNGSGYFVPYREAEKWVKARLSQPWATSNASGAYIGAYSNIPPETNMWLFNHVRASNFSMTDGTYEVNDTWLAMPSGVTHVEDYTIDVSTDQEYLKTVRVQGSIRGLDMAPTSKVSGDASLTPDSNGKISLSPNNVANNSGGSAAYGSHSASITSVAANKYQNALTAWISGVKPYLYHRASSVLNASRGNPEPSRPLDTRYQNPVFRAERLLNVIPRSTSEGHDHKKGIISYGYEFDNKTSVLSGVLTENINITDNAPADVVAEIFVLGRSLGPVLQSLGTKTACTKDLSIDITVIPATGLDQFFMSSSSCPLFTGGQLYQDLQRIVEAFRPFGNRAPASELLGSNGAGLVNHNMIGQCYVDRDTQSWNPSDGRYTRNVSWKYQQCTNTKYFLDH